LNEVKETTLRWLWHGYLPEGKLVMLDGDPGLGKSTVTLDLAARLSRGDFAPDGLDLNGGVPAATLLLSVEDDMSDTVVPRLRVAGADMGRIATIPIPMAAIGVPAPFTLPTSIDELKDAIKEANAKLVVIDPLMAFLDEEVNTHKDASVRNALTSISQLAADTGATIVLVRHLNKDAGSSNALYRGAGSIAFGAAARSVLVVGKDPSDEGSVVLAQVKGNLAKRGSAPSLKFRVEEPSEDVELPVIVWQGRSEHAADDLLRPADSRRFSPDRDRAKEFIRRTLADGGIPVKEYKRRASDAGISDSTLKRAGQQLGLRHERIRDKRTGETIRWEVSLPTKSGKRAGKKRRTRSSQKADK
jgi:archaellum biogenesis ATPase FlaH